MGLLNDIAAAAQAGKRRDELKEDALGLLTDIAAITSHVNYCFTSMSARTKKHGLKALLAALPEVCDDATMPDKVQAFLTQLGTIWTGLSDTAIPVMPDDAVSIEPLPLPVEPIEPGI